MLPTQKVHVLSLATAHVFTEKKILGTTCATYELCGTHAGPAEKAAADATMQAKSATRSCIAESFKKLCHVF